MKTAMALALVMISGIAAGQSPATGEGTTPAPMAFTSEQMTAAKQQYNELTARVTGGDLDVDWKAFRVAAAMAGLTRGFARREDYKAAMSDTTAGNLDRALIEANNAIDRNMADPEAHLLASRVYEAMKRTNEAEHETKIAWALIRSIFASGDGKSPATAFQVVDKGEEQFFILTAQGEEPRIHLVVNDGGKNYDKVTAADWAGVMHEMYFSLELQPQGRSKKASVK